MNLPDISSLFDLERGALSARVFVDADIYEAELERLFPRCWLFLAHESMVPNVGDYMTTYMGTDPVIVVRQKDSSIKAFLNLCRHRGMPVCRADAGNTRSFFCSYHGWSYDLGGNLTGVPAYAEGYNGQLDKSKWGLVPVLRVETYKGLVFGCFDVNAPSLREYLGDMTWYIDAWVDRTPAGIEIIGPPIKWTFHGNWKMAAEQFAGDGYHFDTTHISALAGLPPLQEVVNTAKGPGGAQASLDGGHGVILLISELRGRLPMSDDPGVFAYLEDEAVRARQHVGVERANMAMVATVFPNFSFHTQQFFLRVWHPRGPDRFEAWSWPYAERTAPETIKNALRRSAQLMFSPAGMAEQDDGENWGEIGRTLADGRINRRAMLNYEMGRGLQRRDAVFPGTIRDHVFGDIPQLGFYRRWQQLLGQEGGAP